MISRYDFDTEIDRSGTCATRFDEQKEKFGRDGLIPMWIADMDFAIPECVWTAVRTRAQHPVLGYTTAPDSFWESICRWFTERHGLVLTREDVDYLPGVKKGIGLILNYFTKPGDKVVIQPPVYHSFRSVITGNFREVIDNALLCDSDDYRMDFEGLEEIFAREHPRILIVCNPHNPIGRQWTREELKRATDLCAKYGVICLSDEIYADMCLNTKHIPTASVSDDAAAVTVTVSSPSKSFNIPGLASAWCAVKNPELRDGFFKWLLASEFDTPTLFAIVATEAAYSQGAAWLDALLAYLDKNAVVAADMMRSVPGVRAVRPQAGFGLWTDFRGLNYDQKELDRRLVEVAGVAVSEGSTFGPGGQGFKRINFGMPRRRLFADIERIIEALR